MRENEIKPQFALIMGGAGSGKNYYISQDPTLSTFNLIDVDVMKEKIGTSAAITQIRPMLQRAFATRENVVHPTTGSNLKAQQNKIDMAHKNGYTVTLILINTPIEKAIDQVRQRVKKGGHDVPLENIVATNKKARENFNSLALLADKSKII